MKELWEQIDGFFGHWWWVILLALAVTIVLFVLVVKGMNARIRKLKRQNKLTRAELENARTSAAGSILAPKTTTAAAPKATETKPTETAATDAAPKTQTADTPFFATADGGEDLQLETVQMDDTFYAAAQAEEDAAKEDETLTSSEYFTKPVQVAPSAGSVKFTVKYDRPKDSWVILKEGQERPVRRVDTKEEAMAVARELVRKYNANLVVHKKDGKFQKQ